MYKTDKDDVTLGAAAGAAPVAVGSGDVLSLQHNSALNITGATMGSIQIDQGGHAITAGDVLSLTAIEQAGFSKATHVNSSTIGNIVISGSGALTIAPESTVNVQGINIAYAKGQLIIAPGASLTGEIFTSLTNHHIETEVMGDGSTVFTAVADQE